MGPLDKGSLVNELRLSLGSNAVDALELLGVYTYRLMRGYMQMTGTLESVDTFCYLGDTISAGGGCESAAITRARTAWGKYRDLQPIFSSKTVALRTKGRVYNTCIHSAMLYSSETWAPRKTEVDRLQQNERSMLRGMCGIRPDERVGSAAVCENWAYLNWAML